MKLLRYLASTLLVCLPLVAAAQAGGFPDKAIRIVVPFPPGGATDAAARLVAVKMSEHWGQPVVVDNRAGAGGNVGSDLVAKAPADGYTLVMGVTGSHAINTSLYSRMPYDPVADFVAISQVAVVPNVLVVHPSVPAKNLAELVALAKKEPGKLNYASLGNGTAAHLGMEMLKAEAGVDITHVPYKGSAPAVQDLIGGQTQILIDAGSVLLPQVKGGKLKALAVTGPQRDPQLPDVPTVKELGLAGMESVGFQGLVGPAGMPKDVVDRLAGELAKALAQPAIRAKFAAAGAEVHSLGPTEFAAFVKADNEKWSKLIRERKLQLD